MSKHRLIFMYEYSHIYMIRTVLPKKETDLHRDSDLNSFSLKPWWPAEVWCHSNNCWTQQPKRCWQEDGLHPVIPQWEFLGSILTGFSSASYLCGHIKLSAPSAIWKRNSFTKWQTCRNGKQHQTRTVMDRLVNTVEPAKSRRWFI